VKQEAEFDIIVYGATGYTGQLVAEHCFKRFGVNGEFKWAMAGREAEKLKRVRDAIGAPREVPLVVADAFDKAALTAMAERARVVITTAGPYQLYGTGLLAACATTGTDCLNLTGESHWMQAMIDAYDDVAKNSGARILHSCGFDSIPFELGVYFVESLAREKFGHACPRVKGRVRGLNGTLSGGTAYSGRATREAAQRDPGLVKILVDPFALTPGFRGPEQPRGDKVEDDPDVGGKVAPFFMAPINSKNIHRSNFLQGHAYGKDFVYDEMIVLGPGAPADFTLPDAKSGPKPGEGPSKEEREAGFYDLVFIGVGEDGRRVRGSVYGKKDPGYGSTSMLFAETATCLLEHGANVPGGVSLPGVALGRNLIDHLQAHAGLTFTDETDAR